jgi:hypothetical protein
MQYARVVEHSETPFEYAASMAVHDAIQTAANTTERSQQQQDFKLGASNIGHCRQHAVYLIKQTQPTDVRDKTAAFIGTVLGDAVEAQLKKDHPHWLIQEEGHSEFLSGGGVDCHVDIVVPHEGSVSPEEFEANVAAREEDPSIEPLYVQGVWDLKSKDKLDSVKKYGPSQQQIFQLHQYVNAMIRKGVLRGEEPIWINDVYYDRSGSQPIPYTFGMWYDPAILQEIDEWVHDVKYAVISNTEASKDKSRDWCWSYCEYATLCRGNDTDVEGLIEDPQIVAEVNLYAEANKRESEAKKLKEQIKARIPDQLSGSTGTHLVRWIEIGPSEMKAYVRAGYRKLDIRPIPGPKKPPAKRKPKAAAEVAN